MSKRDDEFLRRLLSTFKGEAEEHLRALSSGLLELEKAPQAEKQQEIVERVFREAHSLKGAARAVNLKAIESLCQSLESIFSRLKRGDAIPSPALFDALHATVDTASALARSAGSKRSEPAESGVDQVLRHLDAALKGGQPEPPRPNPEMAAEEEGPGAPLPAPQTIPGSVATPPLSAVQPASEETVRISTAKLKALLLQAEELLAARLAAAQRAIESKEASASLATWQKGRSKQQAQVRAVQLWLDGKVDPNRPSAPAEDRQTLSEPLRRLIEFLEWNDGVIHALDGRLATLARSAEQDHRTLAGMVNALNQDMKKVLMLPFSSLLEGFPKLVRDLSRDRAKEVQLSIRGAEIEVDRRILEEMKDSFIHLVRNCIDHGIENPRERIQKGKASSGTIGLAISQRNGDKVEIRISDDGAGIDAEKVRAAALKLGVVSQEDVARMDEQGVISLIFHSGVSTSPMITDLSGRGLGLAIVREKVEKLGGSISVETDQGRGTSFRLMLPLTLAAFRGVVVRAEEALFVFPSSYVERAVRVRKGDIQTVENRETLRLNGKVVSLVRLSDVLALLHKGPAGGSADHRHAVVVRLVNQRMAFLVDEVLEDQEVLVKGLGSQLARVCNIAGAAVLGTGKVVPVLNVPDLMKSAVRVAPAPAAPPAARGTPERRRPVLVVEDSITARSLLKNILESAGYNVQTAIDGVDALTALKAGEFELVVSDVDMPRMNGFDLTARVRADKKLGELPVVLVTALESREDRERGIDVGANAYIVKSSFDQSNLLEAIRRLI
jgi:two-component system chemotaxis sensor kinase CheA